MPNNLVEREVVKPNVGERPILRRLDEIAPLLPPKDIQFCENGSPNNLLNLIGCVKINPESAILSLQDNSETESLDKALAKLVIMQSKLETVVDYLEGHENILYRNSRVIKKAKASIEDINQGILCADSIENGGTYHLSLPEYVAVKIGEAYNDLGIKDWLPQGRGAVPAMMIIATIILGACRKKDQNQVLIEETPVVELTEVELEVIPGGGKTAEAMEAEAAADKERGAILTPIKDVSSFEEETETTGLVYKIEPPAGDNEQFYLGLGTVILDEKTGERIGGGGIWFNRGDGWEKVETEFSLSDNDTEYGQYVSRIESGFPEGPALVFVMSTDGTRVFKASVFDSLRQEYKLREGWAVDGGVEMASLMFLDSEAEGAQSYSEKIGVVVILPHEIASGLPEGVYQGIFGDEEFKAIFDADGNVLWINKGGNWEAPISEAAEELTFFVGEKEYRVELEGEIIAEFKPTDEMTRIDGQTIIAGGRILALQEGELVEVPRSEKVINQFEGFEPKLDEFGKVIELRGAEWKMVRNSESGELEVKPTQNTGFSEELIALVKREHIEKLGVDSWEEAVEDARTDSTFLKLMEQFFESNPSYFGVTFSSKEINKYMFQEMFLTGKIMEFKRVSVDNQPLAITEAADEAVVMYVLNPLLKEPIPIVVGFVDGDQYKTANYFKKRLVNERLEGDFAPVPEGLSLEIAIEYSAMSPPGVINMDELRNKWTVLYLQYNLGDRSIEDWDNFSENQVAMVLEQLDYFSHIYDPWASLYMNPNGYLRQVAEKYKQYVADESYSSLFIQTPAEDPGNRAWFFNEFMTNINLKEGGDLGLIASLKIDFLP